MRKSFRVIALVFLLSGVAMAANHSNPYAGQEKHEIKALSHEEVEGFLDGKGMGLAKAAELNNYPGPMHVLQLADELHLSQDQRAQSQRLFESMREEAMSLGAKLVEKERELDHLFAAGTISQDHLRVLMQEIGRLQGQIREAHLRAHLSQKAILTQHQIARYAQLRGYSAGESDANRHHKHGH